MLATAFAPQIGLRDSSRLPAISRAAGISGAELACLFACGALAAAAVGFVHFSPKLPGHAILRGVLPMAMGLALVPRRWVGIIMAISASATAAAMSAAQIGSFQLPAMLSVVALGPVMDVALLGRSTGWRLYARFVLAGALANLLALALKFIGVRLGIAMGGGGQFLNFTWPTILASFVMWGALAGLLGATVWFRTRASE